jgi:two-component system sensor histidine kinase DevS
MAAKATYSADDIRALAEASVSLTSELSLDTVLQKVVDVAREQIGARYAALSVLNAGGEIERFIASGITPEERERIGHVPEGRGLLSVLLHEGASLRLDDIGKDPRSVGFPPNHPRMKSLLGVPVVSHGRILGNLYLTEKQGAREFDERDEEIVKLLSAQAAVAIRNAALYEAESRRADEWRALFDLSREVTATDDLPVLLDSVVRRAAKLLDADVALMTLVNPRGDLTIAAQTGLAKERTKWPRGQSEHGLHRLTIETGRPVIVSDYRTDARAAAGGWLLFEEEGLVSALAVPLNSKDRTLGTLTVANRVRNNFSRRQAELLETFGNLTAIALETRQLYDKLESLARLEERERIGMDLHDGVIQSIYAIGLRLEDCSERVPEAAPELKADLETAMDELNKVIKDIRSYIFDLRPQLSHVDDLPEALRQLVEHVRVNTLMMATFEADTPLDGVGGEAEAMAVFHIAQEALNNVSKHAKASSVSVRLSSAGGCVRLEVRDNGVGFDVPPDQISGAHHGLRNMRDRARSVGAELSYESSPGRGTTVRVELRAGRKESANG